jgi:hypothetical protein
MHSQDRKDARTMKRFSQVAPIEQQALDLWAQRMLKVQYDNAADEPIPEDLMALVRQFPQA